MSQHSSRSARIDGAIDRALADNRLVGAVVLVARHGKITYRRAAGFLDREAGAPMRDDAIFRFASVSKPFVTAAAMRLVERGVIALDQPVVRWLPDFRPAVPNGAKPQITLHQLLTHTSGLSYGFLEPEGSAYHQLGISDGLDRPGRAMDDNLHRLAQAPLVFAPGTGWRYSLGIDVVGAVLEAATGDPLDAIVRNEITGPLRLADTGFAVTDLSRLAVPYADGAHGPVRIEGTITVPLPPQAGDGAIPFTPARIFDPASFPSGGAGMAGTAADLLTFLEVIRTGGAPVLKPETVAAMMRDQVGPQAETQGPGWGFGYGGAVLVDPAPSGTPQAAGTLQWGGAYGHNWFVDRVNGLSVVALTDTAFEGMCGQFVTDLRDAIYG
ncbi:beta-lactamase family protein [Sphingomonas sp. RP10(2022)]|uniref:Beta-lactamase family protein n=1 Tax=Sphingomonas liriopis TaxID=2949094 RepID=A0A9X2HWI6_9SPHN|nr:serine hydrolase domain-containing protein [Sphingomonas liriopis]MCP3733320.1 beta-lactamase family protein [Sphingomonas liriopis]